MSRGDSVPLDTEYSGDVQVISHANRDRLEIFWPLGNQFYPGAVHFTKDNKHCTAHDDGDQEELTLTN